MLFLLSLDYLKFDMFSNVREFRMNYKENILKGSEISEFLNLTTEIVAAHVSKTDTRSEDLPEVIQSVYKTLLALGSGSGEGAHLTPAVPVEESVRDDHIVCLEDGRKLKMLKRHLKSAYGMTPEEYRERWNLPSSYPMVAPSYAKRRSNLAMQIGLGRKRKAA